MEQQTYRTYIQKYKECIESEKQRGLHPSRSDVESLRYYKQLAEVKGIDGMPTLSEECEQQMITWRNKFLKFVDDVELSKLMKAVEQLLEQP